MKMKATVYIGRKGRGLRVIWTGAQEGRSMRQIYELLRERYPEASKITLDPLTGDRGTYAMEVLDKLYGPPPGWPGEHDAENATEPPKSAPPARHPLIQAIPLAKKPPRGPKGPQKRRTG